MCVCVLSPCGPLQTSIKINSVEPHHTMTVGLRLRVVGHYMVCRGVLFLNRSRLEVIPTSTRVDVVSLFHKEDKTFLLVS